MKLYKQIRVLFYILCISALAGCGKTPLLTNLDTNKLIVIIKGTYESNSAQPWNVPQTGNPPRRNPDDPLVQDSSVIHALSPGADSYPSLFMLDVAELV